MKYIHNAAIAVTIIGSLTGCASYVVPRPGKITLEEAMRSVGTGFVEMRKAEGNLRTGLIASDAQVVFNISAAGSQSGKLYVEVSPIPTIPAIQGKAGGEASTSYEAKRGNQITVNFKNVMLADPKSTLLKDPAALKELTKIIREEGIKDVEYDFGHGGPGGAIFIRQPQNKTESKGPIFQPQ